MEKEVRILSSAELRVEGGVKPKITGYAAVFNSESNDLGGFIEIIRPGTFDQALAENPDVSARIQHQGGLMTIGRTTNGTLKLSVDKKGLRYEAIPPNTQAGRDIVELVRDKYITKSSFAFSLRGNEGDRWNFEANPPRRELLNVNLHDVAPVDGPAYDDTSVAVRSMELARKNPEPIPAPEPESRQEPTPEPEPDDPVDLNDYLKQKFDYLKTLPAK